jgi:hypothetical protein
MPNVEIKYMTSLEITLQRNDKECHEKHKSPMFFGKTLDYSSTPRVASAVCSMRLRSWRARLTEI